MGNILVKKFLSERDAFNEMSAKRDKTLPFPENVTEIKNVPYKDDNLSAHRMDIFVPKDNTETLPVIVDIHGGGMILGNKEFNRFFCAQISALGYIVFCPEFSLVPEQTCYDQYADLSAAMDTIHKILKQYNGDPKKVYAMGDSGGAYLLMYAIAMQKCKPLADAAGVRPTTLPVRALGLISGMFYTTKLDSIGLFLPNFFYGKGYKKTPFAPYVNPGHPDIVKALPPCYLVTSHNDNLQHYTLDFAKALEKHGATYELVNYPQNPELTHAFSVFDPYTDTSRDAVNKMLTFLRKY